MQYILMPFSWLLLFFYNFFSSYGIALILFGIVIKTILFPVTLKSKKSMIQTTMLSGKMQQLQKQYGKDKERYNMEVQKLYEKEKVNPMGGCLWSLIPMVVLIALYAIVREPLVHMMGIPSGMIATVAEATGIANSGSFPQIAMAQAMNDPTILAKVQAALGDAGAGVFALDFSFLGMDLSRIPNWKFWDGGITWNSIGLFLLPLVSTVVSFLSMKVSMATNKINQGTKDSQNEQMDKSNKTLMYTMPLMSLWIGFTFPAALCVYWIAQYVVSMVQELICSKMLKKDYEAAREAAAKREQEEKEEEKRRKEEARLERQQRIEDEKKNKGKKKPGQKPKDTEPDQDGVNKEDSREGIRAYARGRAYVPDRFEGVTPYTDPNELFRAQAEAAAAAKGKKKTPLVLTEEEGQAAAAEAVEQIALEQEAVASAIEEAAAETDALAGVGEQSPAPMETEEIEVEVEEIEVEVDEEDDKEGV